MLRLGNPKAPSKGKRYLLTSYNVNDVTERAPRDENGNATLTVGTQRAYFELKYFKIVKMRDAKYSLKMAAEKWRQIFPFLNALYS